MHVIFSYRSGNQYIYKTKWYCYKSFLTTQRQESLKNKTCMNVDYFCSETGKILILGV